MANVIMGLSAATFLIGVIMVFVSVVPALEKYAGKLMGYGFLLAVLGIAAALINAFVSVQSG
jgi:hypothetical protein